MSIVVIEFKPNGKVYYFESNNVDCNIGESIIVETEKGPEYAKVVSLRKAEPSQSASLAKVLRVATAADEKKYQKNIKDAEKALVKAEKLATALGLSMRFIDASFSFERKQLLLNYVSETRIDFRELAKELAAIYKTRIELRQVGVRDKAKEVSGLGQCGLELCCARFLTDLDSVSINMAKNQNLVLNPTKINGNCGRLLCCLNYEDDVYSEYREDLPNIGEIVKLPEGEGKVVSLDILKKVYTVDIPNVGKIQVTSDESDKDGKNNK